MIFAVSTVPSFSTLVDGLTLSFRAPGTGTGGDQINVNSIGASPIYKLTASNISYPVQAGDIQSGGLYLISWDASQEAWILLTGFTTINNATAANQPVALGQVLGATPLVVANTASNVTSLALTTGTFTAPSDGQACIVWLTSNNNGSGAGTLTASLAGLVVAGSPYAYAGGAVAYLPMIAGQSSTFTGTTTIAAAGNIRNTMLVFFQPTP